jgi:hypothetical protein
MSRKQEANNASAKRQNKKPGRHYPIKQTTPRPFERMAFCRYILITSFELLHESMALSWQLTPHSDLKAV